MQKLGFVFALVAGAGAATLYPGFASASGNHIGLDFISSPTTSPSNYIWDWLPYDVLDASSPFVTAGGLADMSQSELSREIALRVEDAFRAIDVGENRTVAIAIHDTLVPTDLAGRRLNIMMGQNELTHLRFLGEAIQNSAVIETSMPNDSHAAAVYLDEIATRLVPPLDYADTDVALNAIVGTTAHEVGHIFNAWHIDSGSTGPYPLMSAEPYGMPTEARGEVRRFSADPNQDGQNNVELIIEAAGVVHASDGNMDGRVDGSDVNTLLANFGSTSALFHEGDANGDHNVDGSDINILLATFGTDPGPVSAGTAAAEYDANTGGIVVSVNDVASWVVKALDGSLVMTGDAPSGLTQALITDNDASVGEGSFGGNFSYTDLDLGNVAQTGLADGALIIEWNTGFGDPTQTATVSVIPEPASLALLGLGGLCLLGRRKR